MRKVLIITYYWPPSGGSGVQRWMYFAKYLSEFGFEPLILTVDPKYASYKFLDESFLKKTEGLRVYRTKSSEPFNIYSSIIGKSKEEAIPQGFSGESNPGLLKKFSRFVRGNFFIPDARRGWIKYAVREAEKIIVSEKPEIIITTGPPHSTHLAGHALKKKFNIKWVADFRDPWTEVYYNKLFYRSDLASAYDKKLEAKVLNESDMVLTIGPSLAQILASKIEKNASKKVTYIYNGYDQEVFKNLIAVKNKNIFTICHLGILSDNQPIDGFALAMKKLFSENKSAADSIKILFIGKIAPGILSKLQSEVPDLKIEVKDYLPHAEAMQEIMNADLLFNSLADVPGGKYLVSGKLMEYIATGNPIICLGEEDGDAAQLLKLFEDAKVYNRKNMEGIFQHVSKVFDNWRKGILKSNLNSSEKYSRYNMTKELAEKLNSLN